MSNNAEKNLSIYIHYPFCKSKCPYCDFNSHVKSQIDHERFLQGYLRELEFFVKKLPNRKIKTIFFGGGTPSLMPLFLPEKILEKISNLWTIDKNCEITLEANPTSSESSKFKDLRNVGINRLSLGIQALNDGNLKFLGREHSASEAITTIEMAAKIFDNFSFDLIYARPKQSLESWKNELLQAINFGTKHLSLYQLTIEKGTKFFREFHDKKFTLPDEHLAAEFYEMTDEITTQAGFKTYEISNYAKKNYECKHNLVYWRGEDYLGIGAGAHSRIYLEGDKERSAITMLHEPLSWLKKVEEFGAGIQKEEKISTNELLEELILMGLRLKEGIDEEIFKIHFNKKLKDIFNFEKLETLANQGLINLSENQIKIPDNKKLLTNPIIEKICQTTILKF
ncbi:MAG: coproporphyrinogen III oxidase [Rickettsiales bacterium]|nr:coproporphyrinogen III oxidase [Rickettsiales bacterium]